MNRKVGGQRTEDIRKKYPGYYQKKGNWKKEKEIRDNKMMQQNKSNLISNYNNTLDSIDRNINILFNLI
jgi:hypothetical protein|tara:strand:+ start:444 stop:650 length:207 start_codon:yes stop_codon:yes gene_type:complete